MKTTVRRTLTHSVTMAKDATESAAFGFQSAAAGCFYVPTGFTAATITFKVSDEYDGDYSLLHNSSDAAVSRSVTAGRWYALPSELAAAAYVKLVGNAAQTTADKTIEIITKS